MISLVIDDSVDVLVTKLVCHYFDIFTRNFSAHVALISRCLEQVRRQIEPILRDVDSYTSCIVKDLNLRSCEQ